MTQQQNSLRARRTRRRARGGFSLVEVLVSALLLSIGVAGISILSGVSRSFSENSRKEDDVYVVARQELERDKTLGFRALFTDAGNRVGGDATWRTDYGNVTPNNQTGDADLPDRANFCQPLTVSDLNQNAAPTTGCSTSACNGRAATTTYRAVSTYSLVATSGETDVTRKLGIQKVKIYRPTGIPADPFGENNVSTKPAYETTAFYSDPTKW